MVFDLFDTLVDLHLERLQRTQSGGRRVAPNASALHAAIPSAAAIDFEGFTRTLADVDREFRETRYAKHLELPTLERFTVLCERLELSACIGDEANAVPAALVEVHMGMVRELAGAPSHHAEVLACLGRVVRIGLCSNFSHTPTALALLEKYELRGYFDAIAISDEIGIRKPRGEIFEAVLRELGVEACDVLHVGDNLKADVEGAASLGMRTAWITRRVSDPERALREHEGPAPDWQIRDLAELPELLEAATPSG